MKKSLLFCIYQLSLTEDDPHSGTDRAGLAVYQTSNEGNDSIEPQHE